MVGYRKIFMAAVFSAIGCQPYVVVPSLDGIDPNWGFNGDETVVEMAGTNLFPGVDVKGGQIDGFDRDFVAHLTGPDEIELGSVRLNQDGEISAIVPRGMTPGWYDVAIQTPSGHSAQLREAFEVTDTRADHIRLTVDNNTRRVEQISIVRLSIRDPSGRIVEEPTLVQITADGPLEPATQWTLDGGDLQNVEKDTDGGGMGGEIGPSGEAFFAFKAHAPGDYRISVEANIRGRDTLTSSTLIHVIAGEVDRIAITPIEERAIRTAGEPFEVELQLVDVLGNTVSGTVATVVLTETCTGGAFQWIETFVDDALVTVTPTKACEANGIQGFGVVEGASIEGQSAPYTVRGGPLATVDVQASPSVVPAGDDGLHIWLQGQDIWGNPVVDELSLIELSQEGVAISEATGHGTYRCSTAGPGTASCAAGLYQAGEAVVLKAVANGSVEGWSNAIQITPGPVASLSVGVEAETVIAGDPLDVSVGALDLFGNHQELTEDELSGMVFYDTHGGLDCVHIPTETGEHTYQYECQLTIAGSGNQIDVLASTLGATGSAGPILVRAGPVEQMDISLEESVTVGGVVAGTEHLITLTATDRFGNPAEDETRVDLKDVGGSLSPAVLHLEDGEGNALVSSTVAIEGNSIWGSVGGTQIGGTELFDVVHGAAEGLQVELDQSWGFNGESFWATINVVDAFGNPAYAETHDVTIEATSSIMFDVPVDGSKRVNLTFAEPGAQPPVVAHTPAWYAESSSILIGDDCGYTASISLDVRGAEDGRVCLNASGRAHVDIMPTTPVGSLWELEIDGANIGRGEPTITPVEWSNSGRSRIQAFVVDAAHCGRLHELDLFIGEEGEVTGPVSVSSSTDTVMAGDPGDPGTAEIWVQGRTCSGDLASGAPLLLQPMKGATGSIEDPTDETVTPRSIISLGSDGAAHFNWSMTDSTMGGTGNLLVGTPTQSAIGDLHLDVIGDSSPPHIWRVEPIGATDGPVEVLTIQFSEPMLDPGSTMARMSLIELHGVTGEAVDLSGAEWMVDRSTLVVTLTEPIDTDFSVWTIAISDDYRDVAGNRLDGDWDGISGGEWSVAFGAVGSLDPIMTGCRVSTAWFRPDGYEGPDIDADQLHIQANTTAPSAWWRLDVTSSDGTHWYRSETIRTGISSGLMTWHGRDQEGTVVPNNQYLLELTPMDEFRNDGTPCVASIVVMNALEP